MTRQAAARNALTIRQLNPLYVHACPHCGGPGITAYRKYSLGPARTAPCRSCGREIGVPWSSLAAMLPFLAGMIVMPALPDAVGFLAPAAGAVAMVWMWRYVPLVRR